MTIIDRTILLYANDDWTNAIVFFMGRLAGSQWF
jgi:hypothetical protein